MSGGSYDYAYGHIADLAVQIRPTSALRRAFKKHLHKVAKACQDIEWVNSNDSSPGDEDTSIRAVLGENSSVLALAEIVEDAKPVKAELERALAETPVMSSSDQPGHVG